MTEWTTDRIDLVKRLYASQFTADEQKLFVDTCQRTGLSPESRQIYAAERWDKKQNRKVMSIQTSIDGFRLIAERTGKYAGQQGPLWCGPDGAWKDVWLDKNPPAAAKVGAIRSDFKEPLHAVARWDSYVVTERGSDRPGMFWAKMPDLMLGKVAEALALRRAFPQELGGLYTTEEMAQAGTEVPAPTSSPLSEPLPSASPTPPIPLIAEPPVAAKRGPADKSRITKLVKAFSDLGIGEAVLVDYFGKPLEQWVVEDFDHAAKWYKELKAERAKS